MADHGAVKIRQGNIDDLIKLYKETYKKITEEIVGATTAGKIQKARVLARINSELRGLGVDVDKFVQSEIPQYYLDGANQASQDLKKLGVAVTKAPVNREAIAALTDEVSLAFAQSMTTLQRGATKIVTDAQKQQINMTIAQGKLTGETRKMISAAVADDLKNDGIGALIDKAGREWSFEAYTEMLVRTKAVEARNQGLANKMLESGYDLVQVTDHGSTHPACAEWEGQILSISGQTEGYPTLQEATDAGLFHPNCEHAINAINQSIAALTEPYDNPYNYDSNAASSDDIPRSSGDGKVEDIQVFHGSKTDSFTEGTDLFGTADYVARDKETAAQFGKVSESTLSIKPSEILTINTDEEYNKLITSTLKAFPGEDTQKSIPEFVKSLGYKAVEGTPSYDPLAGIAVFHSSLLK